MSETNHLEKLTHVGADGLPNMVDVGEKPVTRRTAKARGSIRLPATLEVNSDKTEIITKKGAVIQTAVIAGTQAVKRTSDIIPFCHPLPVDSIKFDYIISQKNVVEMTCEVSALYRTGVEMEALTGVSVALLTVYDMCKSAGQDMEIQDICIVRKTGGKSDINRVAE